MHMQPNTCTNKAFCITHLEDLITTLVAVVAYMYVSYSPSRDEILYSVDVLEIASSVYVLGCMCMFELMVTGWWIVVT